MADIISDLGGPTVIAGVLGIRPPSVISWRGQIPANRCVQLEKSMGGGYSGITVERMRPDLPWRRVADKRWPHPKGRPCLDIARAA